MEKMSSLLRGLRVGSLVTVNSPEAMRASSSERVMVSEVVTWPVYTKEGRGHRPSEFRHHLIHLSSIDGGVIPTNTVASATQEATDLSVHHAAHELLPRGLVVRAELYTCFGGVVEELIVANPEGGIPGLVVCESVHE